MTISLLLKNAIERAEYEPRSYSGRGMYGKYCIGYTTPDLLGSVARIVSGISDEEEREQVVEAFEIRAEMDRMGMEYIIYFKGIDMPSSEEGQ